MNNTRTISARTVIIFALAAILLVLGTIGTARATLQYYSEDMVAEVQTKNISVALTENGKVVANDSNPNAVLLSDLQDLKTVKVGKDYTEQLAVTNDGTIPQYVRVIINKYWTDQNNKVTTIDPNFIELAFSNSSDWKIVPTEVTGNKEQYIAYYQGALQPGATTASITDSIAISPEVLRGTMTTTTTKTAEGKTILKTTWNYNGYHIGLDAEVQAIQTHNAKDAITSSWGVDAGLVGVN